MLLSVVFEIRASQGRPIRGTISFAFSAVVLAVVFCFVSLMSPAFVVWFLSLVILLFAELEVTPRWWARSSKAGGGSAKERPRW